MKSLTFVIVMAILALTFNPGANAGWELYDNFNSGPINTQLWSIDNSSAAISIDNGRVKFVHLSGNPNDSAYLHFIQNPETILGIKADVQIATCTGDVRARIAGYSGDVGENHVWSGLQIQPGQQRIFSSAVLEGPPPNYTLLEELFYTQYESPIAVIGESFNLTMVFFNDKITYEVDGLGKIAYKYTSLVAPAGGNFKSIGTRSTNGDGPCTVYFDNVNVLRQAVGPAGSLLLLDD